MRAMTVPHVTPITVFFAAHVRARVAVRTRAPRDMRDAPDTAVDRVDCYCITLAAFP
jgi:hypothetical protein